ncbi:hypothetical protein [Bacteroides sp.]|uniref:hypothetical protein n=1 Tax=Bacteroides sp. TaxID=29523 RepID=UPI002612FF65|nr:hypothetical protein [Bacteroides sp.]MDD3041017.1 hypothetical protein [Bacteroides sp.]
MNKITYKAAEVYLLLFVIPLYLIGYLFITLGAAIQVIGHLIQVDKENAFDVINNFWDSYYPYRKKSK